MHKQSRARHAFASIALLSFIVETTVAWGPAMAAQPDALGRFVAAPLGIAPGHEGEYMESEYMRMAARGPRGGAVARGPRGAAVRGPNGGAAARGRYGGAVARGPGGNVAVRGGYRPGAAGGWYRPTSYWWRPGGA